MIFINFIYRCRSNFFALFAFLFACLSFSQVQAQSIPVGSISDQQYRSLQLLSDSTSQISLMNRSLWMGDYQKLIDQTSASTDSWWAQNLEGPETTFANDFFTAGIYSPVFTNTFNSELPHGGNNGAAWYGRGLNTELQAGAYLTSDYLTITFRPHLIYTQNNDFPKPRFIPTNEDGSPQYRAIFNNIDMPYRFGPDAYSDFDWGHSSIRIHYKSIEAGISSEPLWWGPGVQNALLLSNNAAGLHHGFLGTRTPIVFPLGIGSLEFKVIWASPQDSKYFQKTPKTDRKRFTTGLNVIFSPGFAPNLSLGFGRFTHKYIPKGGLTFRDFGATLPFFNERQLTGGDGQNQLVSAFFRWVFPKNNAEVYGEYFREDSFYNARDLFMEPDHDRAFTLGLQKVVETNNWFDFFKITGEVNSLVPNRIDEVRPQGYYYRHGQIEQGHTNQGEVLGAAIGPGSASQYIGADGFFENGMMGLFVQRVAENDFFHYEYNDLQSQNPPVGDIYRHRINLNIGFKASYKTGPLLLGGKLIWNKNYNYGRYEYGNPDIDFDSTGKNDKVNIQLQLSARYLF